MGDRSKVVNDKIGGKIRELRKHKGWTQLQLSEKVHKGDSTVRMWELGKSEPDNETVILLAHIFNVSVDYLLGKSAEEMYNGFVESIHNDFSIVTLDPESGAVEDISEEVDPITRAKLWVLFTLQEIENTDHIYKVRDCAKHYTAVKDFSTPLPIDLPEDKAPASPEALRLQNEIISLIRQINDVGSLEVLLALAKDIKTKTKDDNK